MKLILKLCRFISFINQQACQDIKMCSTCFIEIVYYENRLAIQKETNWWNNNISKLLPIIHRKHYKRLNKLLIKNSEI